PEVFAACHQLVFQLIDGGHVTGLRLDHPDGLWDPKSYVARLADELTKRTTAPGSDPSSDRSRKVGVILEKILSDDEFLPEGLPVDGTTGYDFLSRVNGLFVDERSREAFDTIYREFAGASADFHLAAYAGRKKVLATSFAAELNMLARQLQALKLDAAAQAQ